MPTFPKRANKRVDPKDRIGTQTYTDCHFIGPPDENILVCVTWANHVDFRIGETRLDRDAISLYVDLDETSVERLHIQLGDWLTHRKKERDEKD